MKKIITLSTLLLSALVLAGCTAKPTTESEMTGYSMYEVSMHKTQSDCWTSIDGYVYDITSAFGKHKGGDEALIGLCGKNGTKNFEKQHGDNEKAKGRLAKLKIGALAMVD